MRSSLLFRRNPVPRIDPGTFEKIAFDAAGQPARYSTVVKNRLYVLLVAGCYVVALFFSLRLVTNETAAPAIALENHPGLKAQSPTSRQTSGTKAHPAPVLELHAKAPASNPLAGLPRIAWSPQAVEAVFAAEDDGTRHRQILSLLMNAPEEHRPDLADHVANLTPDDAYAPVAWLISNRGVTGSAMQALLQDLHHRPADIKLPVMAEILSQADHPGAPGAEHALNIYLQVSHGYPSEAWRKEVATFLATN